MKNTTKNELPDQGKSWFEVNGDSTYALDWPINGGSLVYEIGGYEGRWSSQIIEKYHPRMMIFEPQKWAYDRCYERLNLPQDKITLHNFALWTHETPHIIGDFGRDGASLLKVWGPDTAEVKCMDAFRYFQEEIDVCLMNIEGGEFVLLPYLIGMGLIKYIKYFWMQVHMFPTDSGQKYKALRKQMEKTHTIIWDFSPTAVCWKRNDVK